MNINVKINKLFNDKDFNLKAFASLTLNGQFAIKGVSVCSNSFGLYVQMPKHTQTTASGVKYYDTAFPITAEGRKHLNEAVIAAYNEAITARNASTHPAAAAAVNAEPITYSAKMSSMYDNKALMEVCLNDEFVIKNVSVRQGGKNGLYVQMPQQKYTDKKTGEVKYSDIAFPTTSEGRKQLNEVVINTYQASLAQAAQTPLAEAGEEMLPE